MLQRNIGLKLFIASLCITKTTDIEIRARPYYRAIKMLRKLQKLDSFTKILPERFVTISQAQNYLVLLLLKLQQ